jgi:Leucine-rich repeat (LRR) protein
MYNGGKLLKMNPDRFYTHRFKKDQVTFQILESKIDTFEDTMLEISNEHILPKTTVMEIRGPGHIFSAKVNGDFPSIKKLLFSDVQLDQLPISLKDRFPNLEIFILKNTHLGESLFSLLETLPNSIKFLQMQNLNLSDFELPSLLEQSLEQLDLSKNKLTRPPLNIKNFKNLRRIILDDNKILKTPMVLKELPKLSHLSLDGNLFDEIEKDNLRINFNIWF